MSFSKITNELYSNCFSFIDFSVFFYRSQFTVVYNFVCITISYNQTIIIFPILVRQKYCLILLFSNSELSIILQDNIPFSTILRKIFHIVKLNDNSPMFTFLWFYRFDNRRMYKALDLSVHISNFIAIFRFKSIFENWFYAKIEFAFSNFITHKR